MEITITQKRQFLDTSTMDIVKVTHTMFFPFRSPYTEVSPAARVPVDYRHPMESTLFPSPSTLLRPPEVFSALSSFFFPRFSCCPSRSIVLVLPTPHRKVFTWRFYRCPCTPLLWYPCHSISPNRTKNPSNIPLSNWQTFQYKIPKFAPFNFRSSRIKGFKIRSLQFSPPFRRKLKGGEIWRE